MRNKRETGVNHSWHDFVSPILTSGISALCLYDAPFSFVHQTHGGIPGEFGVKSESGANGISREFPEGMQFRGNLIWQTFSENR